MTDPAVIHSVAQQAAATHVLLIGISDYPHLPGGDGDPQTDLFGMGQLTSPSASARALATWFIQSFSCPDRPLASVALVLSEAGGPATYVNPVNQAVIAIPQGDLADVRAALRAFVARAAHPDDQIILYFCGHGLSSGAQAFYGVRDFGLDPDGPLDHALNYQNLVASLESQVASNQLLIFDSCRTGDRVVRANLNGGATPLTANPALRDQIAQRMRQCVIFSTEMDRQAVGKPGQPSLCAGSLIRALGGAAAKRGQNAWEVNTVRLFDALGDFQAWDFRADASTARPDAGRFSNLTIRTLPGEPLIPVFIRRADGQSLAGASVTCQSEPPGAAPVLQDSRLQTDDFEGLLPIGKHRFDVVGADGAVYPPVIDAVAPHYLPINLRGA